MTKTQLQLLDIVIYLSGGAIDLAVKCFVLAALFKYLTS